MDRLTPLVKSFSPDETNKFRTTQNKDNHGDLEKVLFGLIQRNPDWTSSQLAIAVYPESKKLDAYEALRKRLLNSIYTFLLQPNNAQGYTMKDAEGQLIIARRIISIGEWPLAKYHLLEAESIALKNGKYALVDDICALIARHSEPLKINLLELFARWDSAVYHLNTTRTVRRLEAISRQRLSELRSSGTLPDHIPTLEEVAAEFGLNESDLLNPFIVHSLVLHIRRGFLAYKEYFDLEPFLFQVYNRLQQAGSFNQATLEIEGDFVYMISQAILRNRQFDQAGPWIDRLEKFLPAKAAHTSPLFAKYHLLRGLWLCCTGKVHDAIEVLDHAKAAAPRIHDEVDKFNIQLNSAVYHFSANQFAQAHSTLVPLRKLEKSTLELIGMESRFKLGMIDLMVQYELDNETVTPGKFEKLRKEFAEFLEQPMYQRADKFIGLVIRFLKNPKIVTTEEFALEVKNSGLAIPNHKEDIHAIAFFCWLKSKMLRRPYYDVLLERLAEMD